MISRKGSRKRKDSAINFSDRFFRRKLHFSCSQMAKRAAATFAVAKAAAARAAAKAKVARAAARAAAARAAVWVAGAMELSTAESAAKAKAALSLPHATREGDIMRMRELIAAGADVDEVVNRYTSLMEAIMRGDEDSAWLRTSACRAHAPPQRHTRHVHIPSLHAPSAASYCAAGTAADRGGC